MPDNKQKTKVYTNKKEFDKANQAYQDSLNLFNGVYGDIIKLKNLEKTYKDKTTVGNLWYEYSEKSRGESKFLKGFESYKNLKKLNGKYPEPIAKYESSSGNSAEEYKKPTTKPIYEEVKPKPKIEPIKPLGIKPMNTSVETKLADKKQEIIQEPMNKKQTYTASPNLKKMGKSTGREYVDGQWIETKSKGGTVKKYSPGGIDLIGSIDPSIMKSLTTAPKTFTPSTATAAAKTPTDMSGNFQMPSLGGGGSAQQTSQDPNAPKKKNIGKIVGSVVGGVAGSVIAPGIGTMIGSTIGGGIGGAIDNKTYKNKVEDYTATVAANKSSQQNAMTSNIPGNFNPNTQGRQFRKGGELIKRADGSYSKRGLWDNIRANKGSGKAPTKEMLEQERKIKKMAEGGIHIKESKKGTFTAAASKHGKSVQGFASQVLANKENYSPAMVKKANFARNAAKWHHAMGGIDTSNSMSGPKYVAGGMLKPMGNDMYEVKSYKKGTDKVEYRPNVFIDNKEIIRKNPDGSTQILSDDLGYAKVAKNIAKAKGGNITDEQFDQLYNAQEMSKASKGKGNKYVKGGTDRKVNLKNPITYKTPGSLGYDTPKKQPGAFDVKAPEVDLKASKFIGETKGKYGYNPQVSKDKKSLDTKVNPLGYLSSLAGPAYNIAQGLKGGDPVNFDRMNTKYQFADPRGAMAAASRGVTSAYNAAKNAARTTTTSAGEYLANMGTLASKEGMDRAAALTGIKAQYDMANTQGLNQTNLAKDQYNAQAQMQESIARQQEQDAARNAVSQGLSNIGQNTMGYTSERNRAKNDRLMAGMLNENYEVVYNKDTNSYEIQPKKGKKSGTNVVSKFGESPKKDESDSK